MLQCVMRAVVFTALSPYDPSGGATIPRSRRSSTRQLDEAADRVHELTLVVPVAIWAPSAYRAVSDWWDEWRWERGWKTHHFIVRRPRPDSELEIPVWFDGTFDIAARDAMDFVERTFDEADLVAVVSTERTWSYIREPLVEVDYLGDEIDSRVRELVMDAHMAETRHDDAELAADLRKAATRLEFLRDSDEDDDDRLAAWKIVEGDVTDAEGRAIGRDIFGDD
jgi:hypothetical protein